MKRLLQSLALALLLAGATRAVAQETPTAGGEHPAETAEREEARIEPMKLALQFLNFGVLVFILVKFGGAAINKSLRARHEQLKSDMEEAARLRATAELRFKEQEKRLGNLESELEQMRQSILKEAEHEKARIIAAAEEKAKRIQEETRFQLDQQVKDAELRFRAEVAQAALKIADELLRRSVTAGDEQRLNQTFVSELATARPQERS